MTGERELERALRELELPGEAEAEDRSWKVVRAAYAERPAPRRTTHARGLALALAGGVAALAIGLSPAGAKVGDLVSEMGEAIGISERDARPALRSLPAAGELLVESAQGPWIVREDGSKRLLGDYGEATWSPRGLFVAAADGRELVAIEPGGEVRWTITAPGPVSDPRWGGIGFDTRIAYRSGGDLWVVAGDGSDERMIASDVAPVAPAWRPSPAEAKIASGGVPTHVLTYVNGARAVRSVNVDTGLRVPTGRADRRRLPVSASRGGEDRALAPDGSRVARLEHVGARDRLIVTERGGGGSVLFSARGELTGPTWSPDGRWLLVGWPKADQWLFIPTERPGGLVAIDGISEQFDPGDTGEAGFARVAGWILPER
jgi:WD40-like Beta Propeller Repeat